MSTRLRPVDALACGSRRLLVRARPCWILACDCLGFGNDRVRVNVYRGTHTFVSGRTVGPLAVILFGLSREFGVAAGRHRRDVRRRAAAGADPLRIKPGRLIARKGRTRLAS